MSIDIKIIGIFQNEIFLQIGKLVEKILTENKNEKYFDVFAHITACCIFDWKVEMINPVDSQQCAFCGDL